MTGANDRPSSVRLSMADHASDVTHSWLEQHAPWVLMTGHWVPHFSPEGWTWVDNADREVCRYEIAQLKAGWDEIVRQSDMTWDLMQRIDWMRLDMMIIQGRVSVVCAVDGDVFGVLLKDDAARAQSKLDALPAIFIALLVIVGSTSADGHTALAAALGVGAE